MASPSCPPASRAAESQIHHILGIAGFNQTEICSSMIGLDIAKSVFQVHGEDAGGRMVLQKRLRRSQVKEFFATLPPARIGIEACGSAHYWARELSALGHEVRLIPAAYVKPFVRRNKTDARDAAAICTALGRPDMRFVAIKSVGQQASRGLERSRDLLVRQHTQLMNSVRGQLAEFGIVAAQGRRGFAELPPAVRRCRQCCSRPCASWCSRSTGSPSLLPYWNGASWRRRALIRRCGGWRQSPGSARSRRTPS